MRGERQMVSAEKKKKKDKDIADRAGALNI